MSEQSGSEPDFRTSFLDQEESFKAAEQGNVVSGEVIQVTADEVVVALTGLKGEGRIKSHEFVELGETVKVGDKVEVKIVKIDEDGNAFVSRLRAVQDVRWNVINEAFKNHTTVEGRVVEEVKGGFKVELGLPYTAFLPRSQASLKRRVTLDELKGKPMQFEIKEMDRRRKNIVLSRRSFLEIEQTQKRAVTLSTLAVGQIIEGVVKNITNFGVFVDIGGVDGLIMIGDLSWSGFIKDASTIVKKGETVKTKVLEFDQTTDPPRIRLGLKQVSGEPWENLPEHVKPGALIEGVVKSFTQFGAFVEIIPGVDGLVHISELSWTRHVKHPSEILELGTKVGVRVIAVDPEKKKISLSLKQTVPDPWTQVYDEYPPGSRVKGIVSGITSFGAFVRMPSGIEGMVHRTDLTWDENNNEPKDILQLGQEIEVTVLRIDMEQKKISLGLKQALPDPWTGVMTRYQKNKVIEVEIAKLLPEGVTVNLEENLEGFIPLSELAAQRPQRPEDVVAVGQKVRAKVTRLERKGRRVFLSIRELAREEEAADMKAFMTEQSSSGSITLGDLIGNDEMAARLKELVAKHTDQ